MIEIEKKIARLIAHEVLETITPEEERELKKWLEMEPANRRLHDRIIEKEQFQTWNRFRQTGYESVWDTIYSDIRRKEKKVRFTRILKIAASFIIPLLVGGGVYLYLNHQFSRQNDTKEAYAEISPGTSKALLLLDDGNSVVLDDLSTDEIREKDGTLIQKEEGKLNYRGLSEPGLQQKQQDKKEEDAGKVLWNTIRIPRGAEYDLVLSDGTRINLNAMSELRYPVKFSGDVREVELTGEAYFEVAHSGAPFMVKVNGLEVEVMGTEFNINAYSGCPDIVTTLVEGKVKVRSGNKPDESHVLHPSQQAVYSHTEKTVHVADVEVSLYTGWKEGKLIFYNDRLEDIMNVLSRWYSADVFYLNPSVKDLKFSGRIDRYKDIKQILDIIRSTRKVGVEVNGKAIVFSEIN